MRNAEIKTKLTKQVHHHHRVLATADSQQRPFAGEIEMVLREQSFDFME
jgi:hypothetical protein